MSLKKSSILSILLYGFVLFSPLVIRVFISGLNDQALISVTTAAYFLGTFALLFIYFKQTDKLQVEAVIPRPRWGFIILYGVLGILITLILQQFSVTIETALFGESADSVNTQNIVTLIEVNPIFIFTTVVAGPIMEELVFRRSLLGLITKYSNFWVGAVGSSIVFSLAHLDNHFLVYFVLGLFFSLQFKQSGRIWTSMITHIGMNLLVIVAQLAFA